MDHRAEPCALSEQDLRTIAIATGVLPPDGEMTSALLEYTRVIVLHCASIGERYAEEDGSAGDEIRAAFGFA
jgi:hypothetical protein